MQFYDTRRTWSVFDFRGVELALNIGFSIRGLIPPSHTQLLAEDEGVLNYSPLTGFLLIRMLLALDAQMLNGVSCLAFDLIPHTSDTILSLATSSKVKTRSENVATRISKSLILESRVRVC